MVLAMLAALPGAARHRAQQSHSPLLDRLQDGVPGAAIGVGAIAVVALLLLGIAVAGAGSTTAPAATAGGNVQVVKISGTSVLANSKGLTLYTFAPDPANKSVCYGSCAQYWPPGRGPLTAPSGVSGTFATIKRTDGTVQATYNGHPLYTYVGDSGEGQAHGNNLNLNGGLWHEVPRPDDPPRGGSPAGGRVVPGQRGRLAAAHLAGAPFTTTSTTVVTAKRPCPITTDSGKFRSGGTVIPARSPRTAAASWARYTPIQRSAMVSPRAATTTSARAAA